MADTPKMSLPKLAASQSEAQVTHNDALNKIDGLIHCKVVDALVNTPPASPAEADAYVTGAGPTGLWSGKANNIAMFYGNGWLFTPVQNGMIVYSVGAGFGVANSFYARKNGTWTLLL